MTLTFGVDGKVTGYGSVNQFSGRLLVRPTTALELGARASRHAQGRSA